MAVQRVPPGSPSSLREANRTRILDAIKRLGAMTQVELADATGLSPATISIIVNELAAAGLLTTEQVTRSGRRAMQVAMSRGLGLVAGLHFSSRSLRLVLCDALGTVVGAQRMPLPTDHRADTSLDQAAELLDDLLVDVGAARTELQGVGVGICAPYDSATDMLSVPGLLRGWDEVRITESLSRRLGTPVVADNDANLAMLAESRFGSAKGMSSAVFVTISHGIGAGIMAHGQILRGHAGLAGEIGHIRVADNGQLCRCGNRGCLEMMVNATAIAAALRNTVGSVTLRDIIAMARQGDIGATRVIADAARHIGFAIGALTNIVSPEAVIIGGELAAAGGILTAPLEAAIERHSLHNPLNPPRVHVSELGTDASALGAAAHAIDTVFQAAVAAQATA